MPLDLQMLTTMPPGTIFAAGTSVVHSIEPTPIRWVAVRGAGVPDWAVYYGTTKSSDHQLYQSGLKMISRDSVSEVVPHDDSAWDHYRL